MPTEITQAELERVRDWANRQSANGGEQPWSAFLLRRLGETIEALLAGMAAEAAAKAAPSPRLVISNTPQDDASCREQACAVRKA